MTQAAESACVEPGHFARSSEPVGTFQLRIMAHGTHRSPPFALGCQCQSVQFSNADSGLGCTGWGGGSPRPRSKSTEQSLLPRSCQGVQEHILSVYPVERNHCFGVGGLLPNIPRAQLACFTVSRKAEQHWVCAKVFFSPHQNRMFLC